MTNEEWLNSDPLPTEIRERDGAYYIPYHIIVEKLNHLCSDGSWDMCNFVHRYQPLPKGQLLISGSVDVQVRYGGISRTLSGAANFVINRSSNPHVAATVKSLAVLNAVKPLGKTFGWGLNGFEKEEDVVPRATVESVDKVDPEKERLIKIIEACTSLADLKSFELLAKSKKIMSVFNKQQKKLTK